MKKVKFSNCGNEFFRQYFNGVIRIIFSFIEDNVTCLNLACVSECTRETFREMMEKSSNTMYQLMYLNGFERKDNTINLFSNVNYNTKFELSKTLYCNSIEEYKKLILDSSSKKACILTQEELGVSTQEYMLYTSLVSSNSEENILNLENIQIVIDIVEKINKEYGPVAMISGGFAFKMLTKYKNWPYHHYTSLKLNKKVRSKNFTYSINDPTDDTNKEDIDIFLLGKNKKEICRELLKKFDEYLIPNLELMKGYVSIKSCDGLVSIYTQKNKRADSYTVNQKSYCKKVEDYKFVDIVIKEKAMTPNDIFCLFDLDCCKIGFLPGCGVNGEGKVVASIDFIRAISTFTNFAPFSIHHTSKKTRARIFKYAIRSGILTTVTNFPHQLSYYHYFMNPDSGKHVICRKDIQNWYNGNSSSDSTIPHKDLASDEYVYYNCSKEKHTCMLNLHTVNREFLREWNTPKTTTITNNTDWVSSLNISEQCENEYYYKVFGIELINPSGTPKYVMKIDRITKEKMFIKLTEVLPKGIEYNLLFPDDIGSDDDEEVNLYECE